MKSAFFLPNVIKSVDKIILDRNNIRKERGPKECIEPEYLKITINEGFSGQGEIPIDPKYSYHTTDSNISDSNFGALVALYWYYDHWSKLDTFYDIMELMGIEFFSNHNIYAIKFINRPTMKFFNVDEPNEQSVYCTRYKYEVEAFIQLDKNALENKYVMPVIENDYKRLTRDA